MWQTRSCLNCRPGKSALEDDDISIALQLAGLHVLTQGDVTAPQTVFVHVILGDPMKVATQVPVLVSPVYANGKFALSLRIALQLLTSFR